MPPEFLEQGGRAWFCPLLPPAPPDVPSFAAKLQVFPNCIGSRRKLAKPKYDLGVVHQRLPGCPSAPHDRVKGHGCISSSCAMLWPTLTAGNGAPREDRSVHPNSEKELP